MGTFFVGVFIIPFHLGPAVNLEKYLGQCRIIFHFFRIGTVHNSSFSGYNWTYQNPAQVGASNPFNVWLLCGVNGSCTDLSPLSQVAGGAWDNANFIGMVLMCLKLLYFNLLEEGMFLFRLCLFVCGLLLCLLFIMVVMRIMLLIVVVIFVMIVCAGMHLNII